ncbi:uncharacterized protein LOC116544787 [Sapajus apella]|uniref:Uncharacterized protein LOC116544787 n=1 Tax=Sapajus apella TaxID=9515 RepID=A0A6J3HAN5_SAPAP|nr:uncharacterized protein LOC116544787 [Sapajus apella]
MDLRRGAALIQKSRSLSWLRPRPRSTVVLSWSSPGSAHVNPSRLAPRLGGHRHTQLHLLARLRSTESEPEAALHWRTRLRPGVRRMRKCVIPRGARTRRRRKNYVSHNPLRRRPCSAAGLPLPRI